MLLLHPVLYAYRNLNCASFSPCPAALWRISLFTILLPRYQSTSHFTLFRRATLFPLGLRCLICAKPKDVVICKAGVRKWEGSEESVKSRMSGVML